MKTIKYLEVEIGCFKLLKRLLVIYSLTSLLRASGGDSKRDASGGENGAGIGSTSKQFAGFDGGKF